MRPLKADGTYKILQFTDLHFGEDPDADMFTTQLFANICSLEHPDLVVITGDIVSGSFLRNGDNFDNHYDTIANVMNQLKTPFAWVPGPADYEYANDGTFQYNMGRSQYDMGQYNKFKWMNKKLKMPFTYDLKIPCINNNDTCLRVFMFATGRFDCMGMGGYDCIRRDAIEWYRETSQAIPDGNPYRENGIAFMHTALQEHMNLVDTMPVHGQKRDYTTCQAINTGLFSEIQQQGTIKAVFAGGDHSTDFWGMYDGVMLGYGRKSGFGSHGPKFQLRGARVFNLAVDLATGDMSIDTYIRQEDLSIDKQEELNPPTKYSWLKKGHCMGADEFADLTEGVLNLDVATTDYTW